MGYKEIKNEFEYWKPSVGDELEGEIIETRQGNYGFNYTILAKDGRKLVTPSHKVLQGRMEGLQKGQTVKIIFDSEEPPKVKGQNKTRIYKVFVKE